MFSILKTAHYFASLFAQKQKSIIYSVNHRTSAHCVSTSRIWFKIQTRNAYYFLRHNCIAYTATTTIFSKSNPLYVRQTHTLLTRRVLLTNILPTMNNHCDAVGGGLVPDRVREKWNILSNSAFSHRLRPAGSVPCIVNKSQIYSIDTQRETQLHKFEIQWCIPHHPASGTHASQSDLGEKILRNCTSTCGIVVARRWCGVTGEHTVLPETTISHSIAITTYVYMHYVRVNIDNRAKEVCLTAASKALQITREFCIGSARLPSDAGASPKKR